LLTPSFGENIASVKYDEITSGEKQLQKKKKKKKTKNKTEYFAEMGIEYSDNVWSLTDSQKDKMTLNAAIDTNRFAKMDSITDLIYSPTVGIKRTISDPRVGKLKLTSFLRYNYYSKNSEASFPEVGIDVKKEMGKNDQLRLKGEFISGKFKKNYMSGVNDANSNGNIPRSERTYSAATYDNSEVVLSFEHQLSKNKKSFINKTTLTPFIGYRKRDYNSTFANRSYDLPYGGVELGMKFRNGLNLALEYEQGYLNSKAGQELFLYDETLTGLDVNRDNLLKENAPVTDTVDRSATRKKYAVASSIKLSKTTTLYAEYSHRKETYTTGNVIDVKRYGGHGYEKKFKSGFKVNLPDDWSAKVQYTREHNKDSDDDEYVVNSYLMLLQKKFD
jgi:hypothetical protein